VSHPRLPPEKEIKMPTYEYECRKCGNRFEAFQNMKDEPLKECPKCRGEVKRLLGVGAGIIFKGNGFYHTDYKSKKTPEKTSCPRDGNAGGQTCKKCSAQKAE